MGVSAERSSTPEKKSTQLLFWKKVFIVGTDFFLILILFYFSEELSRIEGQ